mmetsp:Transcript_8716/g.36517  ORF Transcript_8716/g.36517 Transcript_8716/m.36517 type:complete len:216 (-) Transcript_8716:412-1059(-)
MPCSETKRRARNRRGRVSSTAPPRTRRCARCWSPCAARRWGSPSGTCVPCARAASATTTARSIACTWTATRRSRTSWTASCLRGTPRRATRRSRSSLPTTASTAWAIRWRKKKSASRSSPCTTASPSTRRARRYATRRGRTTEAVCTSREPSRGAYGATETSSRNAARCYTRRAPSRRCVAGTRTERTNPCSTAISSRSRACTWTRSCPTPPPGL